MLMTKLTIQEQIAKFAKDGKERTEILGYLLVEEQLSVNRAQAYLKEVLGTTSTAKGTDESTRAFVEVILDLQGKTISRPAIIEKLVSVTGYTPATANHYYAASRFMIAYGELVLEKAKK